MNETALIESAMKARAQAYAPYSNFAVGAALRARSGKVYLGANVENASYGLTMCAERVALGRAVVEGEREFEVLVICLKNGGSPCGACRQVLYEFSPNLRILMVDEKGTLVKEASLSELLPEGFGPSSL